MKLTVFGAAGEVTGSAHLIEIGGHRVLFDCGLIQGSPKDEARNAEPFPFNPQSLDAVVLSHAHIDHSGRLPLLVKNGFRGKIYTQRASRDLCKIMLKDAAFLNERDVEWENRKRERKGLPLLEPLYSVEDAAATMRQFRAIDYDGEVDIVRGLRIRLRDAGHILGSAIVEIWLSEQGVEKKLVFSGDLGQKNMPILRDPSIVTEADLVLLESTYGDREHRSDVDTLEEIRLAIKAAADAGGNLLIPSFAVGRAQDILYLFGKHYDEWELDRWEIFLDSPMAIEATRVYMEHDDLYDAEARELWKQHKAESLLPNFHWSHTAKQSMKLNNVRSGMIVIAGSGMCTGGRIRHHLKHNLWRRNTHIIFPGFQAQGTPGRAIVDGADFIQLWGETVRVEATVHTINGLSAHADRHGLAEWYGHFEGRPPVLLVHGEATAQEAFAEHLRQTAQAPVKIARLGEVIDLTQVLRW
ncbi:MAG TPA: MBL fold metallo-hydrolase [Thioalkalivibrio sp.]|nr:MBL fold metallo-hydrolase [Thioalkalivibrio sp.]